MLVLAPPVPGPIVRPFHYAGSPFARGLHRGVDLRAPAGERVAAPCAGEVAWAGRGGVTLVCAGRRVTLLPVRPSVRAGARVGPGDLVGAVTGDEGLHLGVRRSGDPFGYLDPAPLLRRARPGQPAVPPPRGPRGRPAPVRRVAPHARPAPEVRPRPAPAGRAPLAPWPAWAGAALLLLGAAGSARVRVVRGRRRRAIAAEAVP